MTTALNDDLAQTPPRPAAELLLRAWRDAKRASPRAHARDVAAAMGASEAELAAARVGDDAIRLSGDWKRLLSELGAVGRVMGLTRNDSAVIEKEGVWEPVSFDGAVGLVLDEGLDLRLFMTHWRHGFVVAHETPGGVRHGLHFFDAHGDAVHKVYMTAETDADAFWALVERFRAVDQTQAAPALQPRPARAAERPDDEVDVAGFQAAWLALEDTHDFFPLLRRYGVSRRQALRLAPPGHARPVPASALASALANAAATDLPIMVFVGSPGCIEIHSGPIARVKRLGCWLNVLDPGFNLHLREDHVAEAFVVRKPTRDGEVTSLELVDAQGDTIAMLFGKRKPGLAEDPRWRALARGLL
ncbi:MAG: hemin-degrading factor [Deltaproteobacteria bacterium]|nr:hemin-degrading factor [Deltaproteobacteria bacterium]